MTALNTDTANVFSNIRIERSEKDAVKALMNGYADEIGYAVVRKDGFDANEKRATYRVEGAFETEAEALAALEDINDAEFKVGRFMKSQMQYANLNAVGNQIIVHEHEGFFGYPHQIKALYIYDRTSHELISDIAGYVEVGETIEDENDGWFESTVFVLAQIEAIRAELIKAAALKSGRDDITGMAFDKVENRFIVWSSDGFANQAAYMIRNVMKITHEMAAWDASSDARYAHITTKTESRIEHAAQMDHRLREAGM